MIALTHGHLCALLLLAAIGLAYALARAGYWLRMGYALAVDKLADGKRWRERAVTAEARVRELEQLAREDGWDVKRKKNSGLLDRDWS